jgi:hypothetical protein
MERMTASENLVHHNMSKMHLKKDFVNKLCSQWKYTQQIFFALNKGNKGCVDAKEVRRYLNQWGFFLTPDVTYNLK